MKIRHLLSAIALPLALAASGAAQANAVYAVSMNTGALGPGSYALAFSFQDGSVTGDGNNTIKLSHFAFGGGSAAGSPVLVGGASGSLGSTVQMVDSDFSSFFVEGFTPGASLSFDIDLTTHVDAGGVPDFFGFSILLDGTPLPTLDDTLGDNLLSVNIDTTSPAPAAWATTDLSPVALNAPTVVPKSPPDGEVPEPGTAALLAAALIGLALARRRDVDGIARRRPPAC